MEILIPRPAIMKVKSGNFLLSSETQITCSAGAAPAALSFQQWFRRTYGLEMVVNAASAALSMVRFDLKSNLPGRDGAYLLDVSPAEICLAAPAAEGLHHGVQTLLQLILLSGGASGPAAGSAGLHIPVLHIEDAPRFRWRGLMLDVCRHFFPASFVKKFIDTMALYKFNILHLHLTDDQGWRIEIMRYPRLTEIGSQRAASPVLEHPGGTHIRPELGTKTDGVPHGGYYTQEEIRDLVDYALARGITIVPEIEMPGHATAALASYPHLGCVGDGYEVRTTWGIAEDVLCAGKESTFEFIENVLDEVVSLFPGEYIHIGGDECPKVRWKDCPHCQAVIQRERLADEEELQSWFIRRVATMLETRGKKLIGWDETLQGGLAPNAAVMSWRGREGGMAAAEQGHEAVMCPTTHCYLDHYQSQDTQSEPPAMTGFLPLKRVYEFDPVEGVPQEHQRCILGGQGNLWTEYMDSEAQVEYMAFPRALALAEVLWCGKPGASYADFYHRMEHHLPCLDAMAVNFCQPRPEDGPEE